MNVKRTKVKTIEKRWSILESGDGTIGARYGIHPRPSALYSTQLGCKSTTLDAWNGGVSLLRTRETKAGVRLLVATGNASTLEPGFQPEMIPLPTLRGLSPAMTLMHRASP